MGGADEVMSSSCRYTKSVRPGDLGSERVAFQSHGKIRNPMRRFNTATRNPNPALLALFLHTWVMARSKPEWLTMGASLDRRDSQALTPIVSTHMSNGTYYHVRPEFWARFIEDLSGEIGT